MADERAQRLDHLGRLTGREREVLALRASGRTIPELATALGVTERTANFHLGNIYAKLDLTPLSQGQRQLALAAYDCLLAEARERGEVPETAPAGDAADPPGSAVLAVLEDEAVAGGRGGAPAPGPSRGAGGEEDETVAGPSRGAGGAGDVSLSTLIELAQQGVTPAFVAELAAAGYADLSPDGLIELAQQGVTGAFIRELREAGAGRLSPDELVEARQQDVTGRFVRELREAGLTSLSLDELVEARQQDVTGAFVRAIGAAGLADLRLDELVELRQQGVDADSITQLRHAIRTRREAR